MFQKYLKVNLQYQLIKIQDHGYCKKNRDTNNIRSSC